MKLYIVFDAMYSIDTITTALWRLYFLLFWHHVFMKLQFLDCRLIMVGNYENIAKYWKIGENVAFIMVVKQENVAIVT